MPNGDQGTTRPRRLARRPAIESADETPAQGLDWSPLATTRRRRPRALGGLPHLSRKLYRPPAGRKR